MTLDADELAGPETTAALLERASALVPVLKERAAETERLRQVAPENVRDLIVAGIIRSAVPPRYGGLGVDRDTSLQLVMTLSRGCGSTGWCASVWMAHIWRVLFFPTAFQDEFFAGGPNVICTDTGTNNWQRVERASGGYRISGQWSFASGCDYAGSLILSATLPEGPAWVGVPRGDFAIVDTWHVLGLRGTGSKDVRLDDAFVPSRRTFPAARLEAPPWNGHALHGLPSLCIPASLLFTQGLTAPLVGIAQAAIDEFVARLMGGSGAGRATGAVPNQLRVAEAQVRVDTARLMLVQEVDEIIARGRRGERFTGLDRLRYRVHHAFAARLCVRAVSLLFEACGGHALYEDDPMQRLYRDAIAVSHHRANAWDPRTEQYGRALLGLPFNV